MRELRKDVDSGLESTKEELDNMDEMKIEDVLMGLKGLKQEEVFSFLGKNNFTPAETEEWLKMMSSTGFSGYDHLTTVDSVEIEQLQLSLSAHFDGIQGSIGHVLASKSDLKSKIKNEPKPTISVSEIAPKTQSVASEWLIEDSQYQRVSSSWPNEEEIIATSIGEELISTSNLDEDDDFKYLPNNTYVIQSSIDRVEMPDKPKPIKLLIKRVESEDEVPTCPNSDSSVTRTKSKRVWSPSTKLEVQEPAIKKKKCTRRSLAKTKVKVSSTSKESESLEELDLSFPNTVHQDDEFVYPSLDMSDDEEDIYNFSQRDDETWTPKIKMKINEVKPQRPTRNRKQNSAVAKYLEAAAMKRAGSAYNKSSKKSRCKLTSNVRNTTYPSANASLDRVAEHPFNVPTCSQSSQHSLPSTSSAIIVESSPTLLPPRYSPVSDEFTVQSSLSSASSFSSPSNSESLLSPHVPARRGRKAKPKPGPKRQKLHLRADFKGSRLIPPKNCKLLQTTRSAVVATLQPGVPAKQRTKSDGHTPSTSSPSNAEKKTPSSHVTKRGKPKKGMATAKQRLGKILKMHKMFY